MQETPTLSLSERSTFMSLLFLNIVETGCHWSEWAGLSMTFEDLPVFFFFFYLYWGDKMFIFKKLSFYLSFLSFTSCILVPLIFCPCVSVLMAPQIKFKRKNKKGKKTVVWHSHAVNPFVHLSLPSSVHWKVIVLVQSLWFLLHYWCWILTGTFLGYPDVVLCCEDSTALRLQDWPFYMLQQITKGVDIGVGWPVFWAWVDAGLVNPPAFACPHHQDELFCVVLASSPFAVMSKR